METPFENAAFISSLIEGVNEAYFMERCISAHWLQRRLVCQIRLPMESHALISNWMGMFMSLVSFVWCLLACMVVHNCPMFLMFRNIIMESGDYSTNGSLGVPFVCRWEDVAISSVCFKKMQGVVKNLLTSSKLLSDESYVVVLSCSEM